MNLPFEEEDRDGSDQVEREEWEENLPLSLPTRSPMPWFSYYPLVFPSQQQREPEPDPDSAIPPPVTPSFITPMDTISVRVDPYLHRLVIILQQDEQTRAASSNPSISPPPAILLDTKKGMELIKLLQFTVRELEQY